MKSATLRVAADLASMGEVGQWLRDFLVAGDLEVDEHTISRIELAVHELVVNSVKHAETVDGLIDLRAAAHSGRLNVEVRDRGRNVYENVTIPRLDGEAQIGGYGLRIIRKASSDLRYRRDGSENVWNVVFELR